MVFSFVIDVTNRPPLFQLLQPLNEGFVLPFEAIHYSLSQIRPFLRWILL